MPRLLPIADRRKVMMRIWARLVALQNQWLDRFVSEASKKDPTALRLTRLIAGILFYATLAVWTMAAIRLMDDGLRASTRVVLVTCVVAPTSLICFRFSNAPARVVDFLACYSIAALFSKALVDGGIQSRGLMWLTVLPLLAQFIGGRIRAFSIAVLGTIGQLLLWMAHMGNFIPLEGDPTSARARMIVRIATMWFVAFVAHLYDDTRHRADAERALLEKTRRDFVAVVSHELRTPLTSIQGALGLLHGGLGREDPEQQAELIRIAHNHAVRMTRMLNDILDIERLDNGMFDLHCDRANTDSLIQEVIDVHRDGAVAKGLMFEFLPSRVADVFVDQDRIIQALHNLVSNAIKFSPIGGSIGVRCFDDGNMVRVEVRDQGRGISDGFSHRVFSRFAQEDASATRATGGSGLGLNIAKAIVERHGGTIGYCNHVPRGCTFYFTLPAVIESTSVVT